MGSRAGYSATVLGSAQAYASRVNTRRAKVLIVLAFGTLLVACGYSFGRPQITVDNRTNADLNVVITHDLGTSTYWVPSCSKVAFDPRAKPEDPDPGGTHPGAVIVPVEVHGPPDAVMDATVWITADRVSWWFGVPVVSPPPCAGRPPDPSPSIRPSN